MCGAGVTGRDPNCWCSQCDWSTDKRSFVWPYGAQTSEFKYRNTATSWKQHDFLIVGAEKRIVQYLTLTTFAGVITMNSHLVAGEHCRRLLIGRLELRVLKADRH